MPADAIAETTSVEAGVSPAPSSPSQPTRLPLQKNQNEPRDLTPGDHDEPPFHLGGQDMHSNSPDGQELAYTSNSESEAGPALVEATSTNHENCPVAIATEYYRPNRHAP